MANKTTLYNISTIKGQIRTNYGKLYNLRPCSFQIWSLSEKISTPGLISDRRIIVNNQRECILTETETASAMDFYGLENGKKGSLSHFILLGCSDTGIQDNEPVQEENEKVYKKNILKVN